MPQSIPQIAEINVSYKPNPPISKRIFLSKDAFDVFKTFISEDTISLQEQFMVMFLNHANDVIGIYPASKGGISGTVVDVRIILAIALKSAAVGIILAHNHPSGNLQPSNADISLTAKLKASASLMDINVMDHIILAGNKDCYYSFADEGVL
jgi:DNA repair protein RadC